jgi:hypothetical protein
MVKVSVLYANGTDTKFDMEYYCNRHIPMGRATWKGHLAGSLFLWHDSERLYTYRIVALHKGDPHV